MLKQYGTSTIHLMHPRASKANQHSITQPMMSSDRMEMPACVPSRMNAQVQHHAIISIPPSESLSEIRGPDSSEPGLPRPEDDQKVQVT